MSAVGRGGRAGRRGQERLGGRYAILLTAFLASSLGNWVYRLALPLLVLHLTGSALSTSSLYAIEYVPFLLLSVPGGVFADRWNRRRLLVSGDVTAGAIAGCLGLLVTLGVHALWPIYLVAFLLACVEPVYHPAFQGFLPQIVPESRLGQANGWMQSGDNIMSMLGPAVAGGLVGLFGFQTTVYVNAASFLVSALAIALIRAGGPAAGWAVRRVGSFGGEIKEATGYILKRNKILLAGSLMFTGTNFAIWLIQANFVFYLTRYRHLSPDVIGTVLAAQGVGAVLGAAVAGRLVRRFAAGRILICTTAVAGVVTLLLVPVRSPVGIAAVWGLVYAMGSINPVAWFTLRQTIVPDEVLGRVVAMTRMLAFASIPVSAVAAGLFESAFHDFYLVIAVGALLRFVIAGAAFLSPLRTPPAGPVPTVRGPEPPVPEAVPEGGGARGWPSRARRAAGVRPGRGGAGLAGGVPVSAGGQQDRAEQGDAGAGGLHRAEPFAEDRAGGERGDHRVERGEYRGHGDRAAPGGHRERAVGRRVGQAHEDEHRRVAARHAGPVAPVARPAEERTAAARRDAERRGADRDAARPLDEQREEQSPGVGGRLRDQRHHQAEPECGAQRQEDRPAVDRAGAGARSAGQCHPGEGDGDSRVLRVRGPFAEEQSERHRHDHSDRRERRDHAHRAEPQRPVEAQQRGGPGGAGGRRAPQAWSGVVPRAARRHGRGEDGDGGGLGDHHDAHRGEAAGEEPAAEVGTAPQQAGGQCEDHGHAPPPSALF